MILTREEYEQIVRQKAKAESEAAVAKSNAAAAIEQADRDAQRKIREAAEETQEEINKIHQDLSEAESKIKYWQGLNENLLRISKERANADRKLKPKKEHTGYVVVSSTEKEYRYKVNRRDFETVMLWETVLQTPYPIDFTEEQAREETKELIGNDGRGNWLIARLGINMYYGGDYEDLLENSKWNVERSAAGGTQYYVQRAASGKLSCWILGDYLFPYQAAWDCSGRYAGTLTAGMLLSYNGGK